MSTPRPPTYSYILEGHALSDMSLDTTSLHGQSKCLINDNRSDLSLTKGDSRMYELRKITVCVRILPRHVGTNYKLGERQKRHMQALEALLAGPQQAQGEPAMIEGRCSTSKSGTAVIVKPSNNTRDFHSKIEFSRSSETLDLITKYASHADESIRTRVESGELSIGDILKAGLDALDSRPRRTTLAPAESPLSESLAIGPRTDRILVPSNSMQVHHHFLPDLYTNNIRWKQFSIVAAIRANAESIGLTFEEITNPKTMSPFYASTSSQEQNQLVRSTGFQWIKPHLRPTEAQLNYPHHPWVDIFPCPIFRERYIQVINMGSSVFDAGEFCLDLQNSGLICWGSHSGERHDASGSGAPWDMRSWEAQPWFLKKWWFVLGGEEGGFFQQSRWWHETRGDSLPYFW